MAQVTWLRRLFGPGYAKLAAAELPGGGARQKVEIQGQIELLDRVHSPVDGVAGAVLEYSARARSAAGRLHFGAGQSAMDLRFSARQAVDFVVRDASGGVLVRVDPGRDVEALHDELRAQYGTELDAVTDVLREGETVRVRGEVVSRSGDDPHRESWRAVIEAHQIDRP